MGDEHVQFREACGASGPIRLAWQVEGASEYEEITLDSPAAVIGRDPCAGVRIDHPGVERRQAYLQLVEGRLYVVSLGARDRVRWGGVPRLSGWLDVGRPVQVGSATLRLLDDGTGLEHRSITFGPGPLSRRYASKLTLPHVILKFTGPAGLRQSGELDRPLALIGRSDRREIRLNDAGVSRAAAALVCTPTGVWVVDVLAQEGIRVNGHACVNARLEDSDVVQLGNWSMRVFLARPSRPHSDRGPRCDGSSLHHITTSLGPGNGRVAARLHRRHSSRTRTAVLWARVVTVWAGPLDAGTAAR